MNLLGLGMVIEWSIMDREGCIKLELYEYINVFFFKIYNFKPKDTKLCLSWSLQ